MAKIVVLLTGGMAASLLLTAQIAVGIRNVTNTSLLETPQSKQLPPFSGIYYLGWGACGGPNPPTDR
jgi:hypothetical protein